MIGFAAESFAEDIPDCAGPSRLREALVYAVQRLNCAGIETARLDAEVLLGHVLAMTREQILVSAERLLDRAQLDRTTGILVVGFPSDLTGFGPARRHRTLS
jgi:hypothetical protein